MSLAVSVVTPTLRRPVEVVELLANLTEQTLRPIEAILVDGAPDDEQETAQAVETVLTGDRKPPFPVHYVRHGGGTAIQRNVGIDRAVGDLVALVDDDVRLEPGYLAAMVEVFERDTEGEVGGVAGYRTNQHFAIDSVERWRWYRRLGLLRVFEPGRYDFECGYPINANMQPPFEGTREVDFMTTACAVWRREVFDSGLRFDHFFRDYGVLEDAHFALRAGRRWRLLQCGTARCRELSSPRGRENRRRIGAKSVVNYYYVFKEAAGPLSLAQRFRFWRFQAFELFRLSTSAIRRRRWSDLQEIGGRLRGWLAVATGSAYRDTSRGTSGDDGRASRETRPKESARS